MVKLHFQSIVQYYVDSDSGDVTILNKYTRPIKGAQNLNRKRVTKELETESIETGDM